MFWQYGSELSTLGDKIEGVNVVSPTWYELKNADVIKTRENEVQ